MRGNNYRQQESIRNLEEEVKGCLGILRRFMVPLWNRLSAIQGRDHVHSRPNSCLFFLNLHELLKLLLCYVASKFLCISFLLLLEALWRCSVSLECGLAVLPITLAGTGCSEHGENTEFSSPLERGNISNVYGRFPGILPAFPFSSFVFFPCSLAQFLGFQKIHPVLLYTVLEIQICYTHTHTNVSVLIQACSNCSYLEMHLGKEGSTHPKYKSLREFNASPWKINFW